MLYDFWYLIDNYNSICLEGCIDAIKAKLLHRNKTLNDVKGEFVKKETRLRKTWESRLSAQISNLPEFDNIYRTVKRAFRQANITEI
jgi:hypothetical protein